MARLRLFLPVAEMAVARASRLVVGLGVVITVTVALGSPGAVVVLCAFAVGNVALDFGAGAASSSITKLTASASTRPLQSRRLTNRLRSPGCGKITRTNA